MNSLRMNPCSARGVRGAGGSSSSTSAAAAAAAAAPTLRRHQRRRRRWQHHRPTESPLPLLTPTPSSSSYLSFPRFSAVPPSRDGGPTASSSSPSSNSSSSSPIPPPPAAAATSNRNSGSGGSSLVEAKMTLPLPLPPSTPPEGGNGEEEPEEEEEGKSCLLLDAEFYATNPGPLAALARAASRSLAADSADGSKGSWSRLPARYRVAGASSLAFVVCNMDKVNMSVAIIPMAHDFGWSPTTSGLVQSAFFAGYALTQVPGGYQAAKRGGAVILPLGVALWSMATAAVPLAAGTGALPLLLLCRAAVGAGEGLAPSSATDMIARATPPSERARTVSFVFGGLHAGSLVGLLAAPPLIDAFGWRAVFYGFGGVGLLWCLWWRSVLDGVARDEPGTRAKLAHAADEGTNDDGSTSSYSSSSSSGSGSSSEDDDESEAQVVVGAKELLAHGKKAAAKSDGTLSSSSSSERVPWRAFLRNGPYRALAATHFANNWLHYALMAWLPTYFRDTLSLSLDQAAAVSLLPPAAALAVASAAGPLADALLEAGVSLGAARKAAQAAAFLPPAAALVAAGTLARGDGPMTVALIAAALGLSSFSLAGLYCNHADLSPRYAPLLLGGTTAVGAVPGVVGVAATGFLLDASGGDWSLALFAPTSALLVLGTAIFTLWGSAEEQEWEGDDGPLWIETAWGQLVNGGGGGDGGGSGNGSENGKGE